jgi:tetratricopeptide (TPR) repeat protein
MIRLVVAVTVAVALGRVDGSAAQNQPAPADVRDAAKTTASDEASREGVFDPRAIVNGAWALEYAMVVQGLSSPTGTAAQLGLDRLAVGDYRAAIAAFQSALAGTVPADLEASTALLLGWAYRGAGDDRQAVTAWRRAISADPKNVSVHLALADAYVRLSQADLAIRALREGLVAVPDSRELADKLAEIEKRKP